GDRVGVPVFLQNVLRAGAGGVRHLGECLSDIRLLQNVEVPTVLPRDASDLLIGGPELLEQTLRVQVALESRDVGLEAVVATGNVEDLNEDFQDRVGFVAARDIRELVDVEQD